MPGKIAAEIMAYPLAEDADRVQPPRVIRVRAGASRRRGWSGLASGPRERARGGAGHGLARERGERGAEGAGAGKKTERKVKAPTGGAVVSVGARATRLREQAGARGEAT